MENGIASLILFFTILLELLLLDRACLKTNKTSVIVKDKRIEYVQVDFGWSGCCSGNDFIIDFELNGKKYSTFVSSKFYKKIERGAMVCLEYGKSRLTRLMIFDVLENQTLLKTNNLKKGE